MQSSRPPSALPRAKGWVVWLAETYSDFFLVQLPGAGVLMAGYHDIQCTAVPDETPATTLAMVRAADERWRLEAARWRPGQAVTTPGTRLTWNCLAGWLVETQPPRPFQQPLLARVRAGRQMGFTHLPSGLALRPACSLR